jgi:hypothetical protein
MRMQSLAARWKFHDGADPQVAWTQNASPESPSRGAADGRPRWGCERAFDPLESPDNYMLTAFLKC